MGYSEAPEQPQSNVRPICHSHAMTRTGREPATIRIAAYRSSPHYTLHRTGEYNSSENCFVGHECKVFAHMCQFYICPIFGFIKNCSKNCNILFPRGDKLVELQGFFKMQD